MIWAQQLLILNTLTGVWLTQGTPSGGGGETIGCSLKTWLGDLNQCNNKDKLGQKDSKDSTINQRLAEQDARNEL